jgi:hypothetical protein
VLLRIHLDLDTIVEHRELRECVFSALCFSFLCDLGLHWCAKPGDQDHLLPVQNTTFQFSQALYVQFVRSCYFQFVQSSYLSVRESFPFSSFKPGDFSERLLPLQEASFRQVRESFPFIYSFLFVSSSLHSQSKYRSTGNIVVIPISTVQLAVVSLRTKISLNY